jgi:hypothetical protein
MNTGSRASIYGFLDQVFGTPFGLNNLGLFVAFLHLKDLGTYFYAGTSADAFFLVDVYRLAH